MLTGASFYEHGKLETIVNFPNGDKSCQWCPYCKHRTINGMTRHICVKTYEAISDPCNQTGDDCPLKFEEENV